MTTLLGKSYWISIELNAAKWLVEKFKTVIMAEWLVDDGLDSDVSTGFIMQSFTNHSAKVAAFSYLRGQIQIEQDWAIEYDRIPSRVEIEQDLDVLYHYEKEDNK